MIKNHTSEETGRRLTDVVITPAMVEAGVNAYYGLGEIREPEDIVELIYDAMATARKRQTLPTV